MMSTNAWSNIPSAYFACEGAAEQEDCQTPGPRYGNCVLDTKCEDPEDTDVNECLLCVDGCWGRPSGGPCRRADGEMGRCEQQSKCTTDPDKSFNQCNRCVKLTDLPSGGTVTDDGSHTDGGSRTVPNPESSSTQNGAGGGCDQVDPVVSGLWILIFIGAFVQRRRGSSSSARRP